jgi:hypothetical protein
LSANPPDDDLGVRPRIDGGTAPIRLLEHLRLEPGRAAVARERRRRHRHVGPKEQGAGLEDDAGLRELLLDAGERRRRSRGPAVVVAEQHAAVVGERPHHGDPGRRLRERQHPVVLQQHDRLARELPRKLPVRGAVELAVGQLRRLHALERIEQPDLEADAQHALERRVDFDLAEQPLLHRVDVALEVGCVALVEESARGAVAVEAGLDREGAGFGGGLRVLVARLDIAHGVAVARHEPLELPVPAQRAVEQGLAGAARHAVDCVVDAHHRLHAALDDRGAERGQVGVLEVVRRGLGVEAVPQRLGAGVDGVVLGGRRHDRMLGVVALQAGDEGHAERPGEERVLAVGLLAASPARVAEDVDVRRERT